MTFRSFIRQRIQKATVGVGALLGLCKQNGGINGREIRTISKCLTRPTFTYGSELWSQETEPGGFSAMTRLEYNFLRKISRANHGCSGEKLAALCNNEGGGSV